MKYETKQRVIDAFQLPHWIEVNTGDSMIQGRKGDYLVLEGDTLRILSEAEFLAGYQPLKPPPIVSATVWRESSFNGDPSGRL